MEPKIVHLSVDSAESDKFHTHPFLLEHLDAGVFQRLWEGRASIDNPTAWRREMLYDSRKHRATYATAAGSRWHIFVVYDITRGQADRIHQDSDSDRSMWVSVAALQAVASRAIGRDVAIYAYQG